MNRKRDALADRERRRLTILFGDLQGFTAASEDTDPEIVAEVVGDCLDQIRAEIERCGGLLSQTMGDGYLALFGTPVAREDDAERAIECALASQRVVAAFQERMEERLGRRLPLRIGINTGPTVVSRPTPDQGEIPVTGDAVNVAARLEGLAEPGGILVSESTRRLADRAFEWGPARTYSLKGRLAPVVAYEVVGPTPDASRRPAGPVNPFIGRTAELDALDAAWEATCAGDSRAVILEGPPGSGKSRLVHEFLTRLEEQGETPRVAFGSSSPRPSGVLDPLRRMVVGCLQGEPADRLTEDPRSRAAVDTLLSMTAESDRLPKSRNQFRDGLVSFFTAWMAGEPALIVVEDAQWADTSSVKLIREIQQAMHDQPLLLIYLQRRSEQGLPRGVVRAATQIPIEPLGEEESGHLLTSLIRHTGQEMSTDVRRQVLTMAEGIPLFLEEIVRMLALGDDVLPAEDGAPPRARDQLLPETVEQIFLARLDRVEPRSRQLAQDAAVIGRSFPDELLAAITDAPSGIGGQLRRLERADLLRYWESFAGDGHEFKSQLTWNTLYESLLMRRREALHLRIAETIERMYPDALAEFAQALATHYELGGDPELAAHYYLLASRQSQTLFSETEARSQRQRAARLVGLTSLWAFSSAEPRPGRLMRGASIIAQSFVATALVLPIFVFLMGQGLASSDRIIGFPAAVFDLSLPVVTLPLVIGAVPVFLTAIAVATGRGAAYVEHKPTLAAYVRDVAATWLFAIATLVAAVGVIVLGVRLGQLGPVLDAVVVSTAKRLVLGGGRAGIVLIAFGLLVVAALLVWWMSARARVWRSYLAQREQIGSHGAADRRVHARLAALMAWAAAANLLLLLLYTLRLLPGSANRVDIAAGSLRWLAIAVAAQIGVAVGLWMYARRIRTIAELGRSIRSSSPVWRRWTRRTREQSRRPQSLGLEVPLVLAMTFGVILALPAQENVLVAFRDVFEQPELSQAERLVDLFPRSAYTHALRGGVHLADGSRGTAAAERDFRRALELDPKFHSALAGLAAAQLADGDIDGALATTRRFVEAEPDHPTPYFQLALMSGVAGDLGGFFGNLERTLEIDVDAAGWDAYLTRCQAELAVSQFEAALSDCLATGELNSYAYGTGGIRPQLVAAYRGLGKEADAVAALQSGGVPVAEIAAVLSTLSSSDLPRDFDAGESRQIPTGALYTAPQHRHLSAEHGVEDGYVSIFAKPRSRTEFDVLVSMVTVHRSVADAENGYEFQAAAATYDAWKSEEWPADPAVLSLDATQVARTALDVGDRTEHFVYELTDDVGTVVDVHDVVVSRTGRVVSVYIMSRAAGLDALELAEAGHDRAAAAFAALP